MRLKPSGNVNNYFASLLVACLLPFAETIFIKSPPLLAQVNQTEHLILSVDPHKGDDRNSGTSQSPFKTITQALKIAGSDTVISLAPGTYSEATGENFPLIIRDRITLQGVLGGNGRNVVIRGSGLFLSRTGAGQNVAIAALSKTKAIQGITIINPDDRGHGLWLESASPEISHNTFIRSGNTGLSANGQSKPLIINNYFGNNGGNGLLIYGQSAPTVTDNIFENTGFGISLVQQSIAMIEDNEFRGNRIGLIFEGESQGKLHGNTIITSSDYGLVAIANSQVDLGNSAQPGENIFRSNQKLAIQNLTNKVISANGTRVSGATEGEIDFSNNGISPVFINSSSPSVTKSRPTSRLRNNPLPNRESVVGRSPNLAKLPVTSQNNPQPEIANPPRSSFNAGSANESTTETEILPPPPVVTKPKTSSSLLPPSRLTKPPKVSAQAQSHQNRVDTVITGALNSVDAANSSNKEFVFTAPPSSNSSPTIKSNSQTTNVLPAPNASSQKPADLPLPPFRSPSVLGSNSNQPNVRSLSDLLGSSRSEARFRVLVEANHSNQQKQILSLYPDATKTIYQGKSMFQVGVFSDRTTAEKTSRSLANLRLTSYILD